MPRRKQTYPQKMNSFGKADEQDVKKDSSLLKTEHIESEEVFRTGDIDTKENTTMEHNNAQSLYTDAFQKQTLLLGDEYSHQNAPIDLSMKNKKIQCSSRNQSGNGGSAPNVPSSLQALELKFGGQNTDFLASSSTMSNFSCDFKRNSYQSVQKNVPLHGIYARQFEHYLNINKAPKDYTSSSPPVQNAISKQDLLEQARARLHAETSRHTKFVCICDQTFESLYKMSIHLKETGHAPSKENAKPTEYPKLVRGQDMWLTHGSEQTKEILKCICCRESFKSLPDLTVHMMKTKHYASIMSQRAPILQNISMPSKLFSDTDEDLVSKETFTCKVCSSMFSSMEHLAIHMNDTGHHKINSRKNSKTSTKLWKSSHSFRNELDTTVHCQICKKRFLSIDGLTEHLETSGHRLILMKRLHSQGLVNSSSMEESWGAGEKDIGKDITGSMKRKVKEIPVVEGKRARKSDGHVTIECDKCQGQIKADVFSTHVRQCLSVPKESALEMLTAKFGMSSVLKPFYNNSKSGRQIKPGTLSEEVQSGLISPSIASDEVQSRLFSPSFASSSPGMASVKLEPVEVNEISSNVDTDKESNHLYVSPPNEAMVESNDIFIAMEHMIKEKIVEKSKDMHALQEQNTLSSMWQDTGHKHTEGVIGVSTPLPQDSMVTHIKTENTDDDNRYGIQNDHVSSNNGFGPRKESQKETGFTVGKTFTGTKQTCKYASTTDTGEMLRRHSGSKSVSHKTTVPVRPASAPSKLSQQQDSNVVEENLCSTKLEVLMKSSTDCNVNNDQSKHQVKADHLDGKYLQPDARNPGSIPVLQSLESLVHKKTSFVQDWPPKHNSNNQQKSDTLIELKNKNGGHDGNPLDSLKKLISSTNATHNNASNILNILGTTNLPNLVIPFKEPSIPFNVEYHQPNPPKQSSILTEDSKHQQRAKYSSSPLLNLKAYMKSHNLDVKTNIDVPNDLSQPIGLDLSVLSGKIQKRGLDFDEEKMKPKLDCKKVNELTSSHEAIVCEHCRRIFRTKGGLRYHMTSCMPIHSAVETRKATGVKNVIQKHLQHSQFTRYYKWAEELSGKS